VDWRKGLWWGLAAFATFTLAPGLGLPPEVPGTSAGPLLDRQIWWVATAVATGGGLAAIFLGRRAAWVVGGVVLIALPHLVGAPQPAVPGSAAPESLAHLFIAAAVATSLLFWLVLGSLTGFFYQRMAVAA
jgi:cobalt transporter subunit CbtA